MPNIKKTVLKYTLQNAVRYKGKAQLNNVIPKVIGEIPSVRSDMTFLISTINNTIKEVNLLTQENQIKKLPGSYFSQNSENPPRVLSREVLLINYVMGTLHTTGY